MNYRVFGKTGWRISEIGLGTMPLSGMYGPVDDNEAVKTTLYALEQGINFIDTALMYGSGRAHLQIAKALRQWDGHKVYVATKALARPLRRRPHDARTLSRLVFARRGRAEFEAIRS
jgi:aryl-alcohol dehydrogenase-like predicted oxidoreductase